MYKVQCGQPLPSHHFPEGVMYIPVGQFERVYDPDVSRRVRQHTDHSCVSVHHTMAIQTILVWVFTTPSHTTESFFPRTLPSCTHNVNVLIVLMWLYIWLLPVLLLKTEASYPNCSIVCYIQWVAWWYGIDFSSALSNESLSPTTFQRLVVMCVPTQSYVELEQVWNVVDWWNTVCKLWQYCATCYDGVMQCNLSHAW